MLLRVFYSRTTDLCDRELPSKVNESRCLRHAAILVGHQYIQCLSSLLYGSVQYCAQITADDVDRLADAIDVLVDRRVSHCVPHEKPFTLMLVSDLCTILCPLLQYGSGEIVATLRYRASLLEAIPEAARLLLHHGKELADPCTRFYTMLMRAIFKDGQVGYVSETEQPVTLPIVNDVQPTALLTRKRDEPELEQDATFNLNEDLISSYFELNRRYQDSLLGAEISSIDDTNMCLQKEWETFKQLELKRDHARLEQENNAQQEEISRLRDELKRTQTEREQFRLSNIELARSVNELKQISAASSTIPSPPTALPDPGVRRNDEGANGGLESLSPHSITVEQAESFIQDIYRRRMAFNGHDMQQSVCGSLKHLGSNLYSSSVHFLHELIQVLM